jgi:hypothetical protein
MVVTDPRVIEKLCAARLGPEQCVVSPDPNEAVEQACRALFPGLERAAVWAFTDRGPLSCVTAAPALTVWAHAILNRRDTPPEVIRVIAKHELLHFRFPPREADGGTTLIHPPEFVLEEGSLSPLGWQAWAWIWRNLGPWLERRKRLQRIDIRATWRDSLVLPAMSLDDVREEASGLAAGVVREAEMSGFVP